MPQMTRRQMAKAIFGCMAGALTTPPLFSMAPVPQEVGEHNGSRAEMFRIGQAFMRKFYVPGMSVAVSRNGRFVYEHQFGMADKSHAEQVLPSSLFRIASVTKPITSVTIFSLIEQGKLNLNDKVFGPSGILGTKYGKPPYQQYVTDITVDHLLTHTCGGWPNDSTDPMMRNDSWDQEKLISETLKNLPLTNPPGQHWAYSNFGYCILGRVIEQVTGQTYADYVQSKILAPCGISDTKIAANKMKDHAPNEVIYTGQFGEDPYKLNITRMDSHGGWIATPSDLVQFLNAVNGSGGKPALLKPETVRIMTTPAASYPQGSPAKYARGWMVREDGQGNWWHNGSLPGTTSIMVRTATGLCWAALINTRTQPSNEIDTALDEMMWDMVRCVPAWGA